MNPSQEHNQCSWVVENIDNYLDGDLSTCDIQNLEQHVSECLVCRSEIDLARNSLDALHEMPVMNCPDSVVKAAMEKIDAPRVCAVVKITKRSTFWYRFRLHMAGIAAICLGIFTFTFNTGHEPDTVQLKAMTLEDVEIQQAREQAEWALGYIGYISSNTASICEEIIEVKVAPTLQNAAEDLLDTQFLPKEFKFI